MHTLRRNTDGNKLIDAIILGMENTPNGTSSTKQDENQDNNFKQSLFNHKNIRGLLQKVDEEEKEEEKRLLRLITLKPKMCDNAMNIVLRYQNNNSNNIFTNNLEMFHRKIKTFLTLDHFIAVLNKAINRNVRLTYSVIQINGEYRITWKGTALMSFTNIEDLSDRKVLYSVVMNVLHGRTIDLTQPNFLVPIEQEQERQLNPRLNLKRLPQNASGDTLHALPPAAQDAAMQQQRHIRPGSRAKLCCTIS